METIRRSLGFIIALTGGLGLVGLAFIDMLLRVRRAPDAAGRRAAIGQAAGVWAERVLAVVCRALDMRFAVSPPIGRAPPSIVVANHGSTLDIIFTLVAMRRLGIRQPRFVAKRAVAGYPLIGWMCTVHGGIYVRRNRDPRDIEDIRAGAALAAADGASPVIYPEGGRGRGGTDGYRHLGPPKRRGYDALREALPDYPVLRLLTRRKNPRAGKTIFDAADFWGDEVLVEARRVPAEELAREPDWLTAEWRRMDAQLDAPR